MAKFKICLFCNAFLGNIFSKICPLQRYQSGGFVSQFKKNFVFQFNRNICLPLFFLPWDKIIWIQNIHTYIYVLLEVTVELSKRLRCEKETFDWFVVCIPLRLFFVLLSARLLTLLLIPLLLNKVGTRVTTVKASEQYCILHKGVNWNFPTFSGQNIPKKSAPFGAKQEEQVATKETFL